MIDELTALAAKAEPPVREVTGLVTDGAVPAARVVDRRRVDPARRPSRCG